MARSEATPRWMVDANMLDIGNAMACVRSDVVDPGHPGLPEVGRHALDDEWIPVAGRLGLVVLSRDKRLRYKPVERRALVAHGVRVVNLTSGNNLSSWERLSLITRFWRAIEDRAAVPGPWMLALSQGGLREAPLT